MESINKLTENNYKYNINFSDEQKEIISSYSIGSSQFSDGRFNVGLKENQIEIYKYMHHLFKDFLKSSLDDAIKSGKFKCKLSNLTIELNKEMTIDTRVKLPRQFILDNFKILGLSVLFQNKAWTQFWGDSVVSDLPKMINICTDKFSYDDNVFLKNLLIERFNVTSEIKKVKPLTNGDEAYNIQIKEDVEKFINIIKPYIFKENLYKISYKEYLRKNYKEDNFNNYYIDLVNNYEPSFFNAPYYFDEFEQYMDFIFKLKSKYKLLTIREFKKFTESGLSTDKISEEHYKNLVKFISRLCRKQIKITEKSLKDEYLNNGLSLNAISKKYDEKIDDILFLKQLYNIPDSNLNQINKMKKLYNWDLVKDYLDIDFNETANISSSKKNITFREFKKLILDNKTLNEIKEISSPTLIEFFSVFCQGKINLNKETLENEYKNGSSLEEICKKYNINCDFKTYLRRLYNIDILGGRYIQRINNEIFLTQRQKEIAYGSLLGDAMATNGIIQFRHGQKQIDYLKWKYHEFKNQATERGIKEYSYFHESRNSTYYGADFYTKTNSDTIEIETLFYKDRNKQVSKEICDLLTALSITTWIMDDGMCDWGYRNDNNCLPYMIICTDSFNDESCNNINNMFKEKFDIISYTRKAKHPYSGKIHNRTCFSTTETQKLFSLIKPIIEKEVPSMLYKVDYNAYLIYRANKNLKQDENDKLLNSFKK